MEVRMGEVLQFGKRYEEIKVQDEDGKEITTLRINTSDAGTATRFRNVIKKIQAKEKAFHTQANAMQGKLPENPEIDDMMPVFDLHLQYCKDLGQDIDEMFGAGTVERMTAPNREINPDFIPDETWYADFIEMVTPVMERLFNSHFEAVKKKYGAK